jgi:hypothetical protein
VSSPSVSDSLARDYNYNGHCVAIVKVMKSILSQFSVVKLIKNTLPMSLILKKNMLERLLVASILQLERESDEFISTLSLSLYGLVRKIISL